MSWSSRSTLAVIAVFAALGVACASAGAATPLPHVTGPIPVTATSYPFGAADHTLVPEDLRKVGYVEDEYLVSGTANVYTWPAPGPAGGAHAERPVHDAHPRAPSGQGLALQRQRRRRAAQPVQPLRPQHRLGDGAPPDGPQRRRLGRDHGQAHRRAGAEEVRPRALRLAVVRQPARARRSAQLRSAADVGRPAGVPLAGHRGRAGLGHLQPGRRAGAQPRPRQPGRPTAARGTLGAAGTGPRSSTSTASATRRRAATSTTTSTPSTRSTWLATAGTRSMTATSWPSPAGTSSASCRSTSASAPPGSVIRACSSPTSACRSSTSCRSRTTSSASTPGVPTATRRPIASATTRWPAPVTRRRTS